RLRACEVVGLRELLVNVVQLPGVVIETGAARGQPRQSAVQTPGDPAVVVERAVAEHLEVLGDSPAWCGLVAEGVGHADALDGLLRDTVDFAGFGDAGD